MPDLGTCSADAAQRIWAGSSTTLLPRGRPVTPPRLNQPPSPQVFSKTYCPYCVKAKRALQQILKPSDFLVMEASARAHAHAYAGPGEPSPELSAGTHRPPTHAHTAAPP